MPKRLEKGTFAGRTTWSQGAAHISLAPEDSALLTDGIDMHNGRFKTLEEVLNHYSGGIQFTDTLDPNLAKNPDGGLHLNSEDKKALISFLNTLTDKAFEKAPAARAPWTIQVCWRCLGFCVTKTTPNSIVQTGAIGCL